MDFTEFGLDPSVIEGIEIIGFKLATPVQEKAIPLVLQGKDLIASAQTGTGKTAAFLLPIIHKLLQGSQDGHVKALVIVPTRELAVQIDQQMQGFSYYTSLSSIAVYGGSDGTTFSQEKQALSQGADVIIGTPGRLIAHLNMGYVKVRELQFLVLDEADRMLDMGFHDDIMKIISFLPEKRQNLLFAATMPVKIRELARTVLHDPEEINIAISKPVDNVLQAAYIVYESQKIPLVMSLLQPKRLRSIIIFCSTKSNTKQLSKELKRAGLSVEEIHSDLEQKTREKVLQDFKNRDINILVATDIVARGIDIEDIDLIINYDVPNDGEDYIHRIGRTARAQAEGMAITFVNEKEQYKFGKIEELLEKPVPKMSVGAQFGTAPEYKPKVYRQDTSRRNFRTGKRKR